MDCGFNFWVAAKLQTGCCPSGAQTLNPASVVNHSFLALVWRNLVFDQGWKTHDEPQRKAAKYLLYF